MREPTCDVSYSLIVLAEAGVVTEGNDPNVGPGRDEHLVQLNLDITLDSVGLSTPACGSKFKRRLFSQSGGLIFFLKLNPRKILPDDDAAHFDDTCDWSDPSPL